MALLVNGLLSPLCWSMYQKILTGSTCECATPGSRLMFSGIIFLQLCITLMPFFYSLISVASKRVHQGIASTSSITADPTELHKCLSHSCDSPAEFAFFFVSAVIWAWSSDEHNLSQFLLSHNSDQSFPCHFSLPCHPHLYLYNLRS